NTEMQIFNDVFTAVGAPPGNYRDVTALFSTFVQGGQGGAGVFGFCRVIDVTRDRDAFQIAKYLDNDDEGKEFRTPVSQTRYGRDFVVVSEIDPDDMLGQTNLHVAYFQHPDRIRCELRFTSPHSTFDQIQMRLIDPDDQVVAGGAHQTFFTFDAEEKSVRHNGQNGRWMGEVAPDRGDPDQTGSLCLHPGGRGSPPDTLTR